MEKKNTFRELEAYKQGKIVVKEVYRLLKKFPREEQYALCDQLRRAAISITSNIAEGSGRSSCKEKIHFFEFSYASLMEVLSQLDVAMDLGYITEEEFNNFEVLSDKECRLLSGLTRYFQKLSNP
ncbi:MAG: four helix bundle protein [Candidatus Limimorpha sp.]